MTRLVKAIATMKRLHPRLAEPDYAAGRCCHAAGVFSRLLPGAVEVHHIGQRARFTQRVDDYPPRDPHFYHVVNLYGGKVVDWTRRQLDPRSPFPYVVSVRQFRREAMKLGTLGYLELI